MASIGNGIFYLQEEERPRGRVKGRIVVGGYLGQRLESVAVLLHGADKLSNKSETGQMSNKEIEQFRP
jgi:hypothetical protein